MLELSLSIYVTAGLGALVLIIGAILVKQSPMLKRMCIPAAVVGGILFSIICTALYYTDTATIELDGVVKDLMMMVFFCSIGFMASIRMIRSGGRMVLILIALVSVLILVQDIVGTSMASAFGYDPKLGLCLGSISLVGGHGTAASYGQLLVDEYGITGADSVAVAVATYGLAVSGFIGGPLARRLIKKYDLSPSEEEVEMSNVSEKSHLIDENKFLIALILILVCIAVGVYVTQAFSAIGVTTPVYLGAMIVALIIRNIADHKGYDLPIKEISTLGTICLAIFLSLALMGLKLWQIADLAGFMVLTLIVQTVIVAAYVYFVVFRMTGKNYDSAVYVTATTGFSLGATPNAMANMQALMDQHGPAPVAYFIVPLVGSVFVDFINTGVLVTFLNLL